MALYYKRKIANKKGQPLKEPMNFAERWMSDGIQVCPRPGFVMSVEVDVSICERKMADWKSQGAAMTYPAILVRIAAMALAKEPQLHVMLSGYNRFYPEHVEIALSVAGESFVSPLMVIREAETKDIFSIAEEIRYEASQVRERDRRANQLIRRWGWLIPFGWLRRAVLDFLFRRIWFQRKGAGTFQVSCLPDVDVFIPYIFSASALLAAGRVTTRPVMTANRQELRPMMTLTCSANHSAWDGLCGNLFLKTVKQILESGEFLSERTAPQARAELQNLRSPKEYLIRHG